MNERTKARVRERAENCCEYCRLDQNDSPLAALHIEHITPKIHGGTDDFNNLALACIDCNLHKGPNLTGIDPQTKKITPLFHPRRDNWDTLQMARHLPYGEDRHRSRNHPGFTNEFRGTTFSALRIKPLIPQLLPAS
ncbi:MAG TPA: HNH endonuclease signature motif containing protein [Verrucomicrobiae bacterium]|jgi:hypothetical protein|nr:HNH endonuclease signature motif containing protein [Verrucomicrobiae bacterium]